MNDRHPDDIALEAAAKANAVKTSELRSRLGSALEPSTSTASLTEEHPNAEPEPQPEVISEADLTAALAASGAHLGPPTPEEERQAGRRIDLTPEEQTELAALAGRIAKKRMLFMDQILVAAAQMKLLEDNYAFRIQELAGEHKMPEGWIWDAGQMCFKPKS